MLPDDVLKGCFRWAVTFWTVSNLLRADKIPSRSREHTVQKWTVINLA